MSHRCKKRFSKKDFKEEKEFRKMASQPTSQPGQPTPTTSSLPDPLKPDPAKKDYSKSAKIIEDLKFSNPGIYRIMTGDGLAQLQSSMAFNPAYSGMALPQLARNLQLAESLFQTGLSTSPQAQSLYSQALAGLQKQAGSQQGGTGQAGFNPMAAVQSLSPLAILFQQLMGNWMQSSQQSGTQQTGNVGQADPNAPDAKTSETTNSFTPATNTGGLGGFLKKQIFTSQNPTQR
jgi:hypothetical protein